MEINGWMGRLYVWADWLTKLLYVNVLWYLFSILGVGVAGVFPSTAAMFAVVRKWVLGEDDVPVFKTFWHAYKLEFWRANLLGYGLTAVGVIFFFDIRFFAASHSQIIRLVSIIVLASVAVYAGVVLYIFPVFVHFQAKLFAYLRLSFVLALVQPIKTLLLGVAVYFMAVAVRGWLPFFLLSTWAYIIMKIAYRGMQKIDRKREALAAKAAKSATTTTMATASSKSENRGEHLNS